MATAIELMHATDPAWTHPLSSVAIVRAKKLSGKTQPERGEIESAQGCLTEVPAIFRDWAFGRRSLLVSTDS